jgi:hypothetical protein
MQTRTLSASTVFDLIRPRSDVSSLPKATKLHLTVFATLVSLGFAALWGAAVGSSIPALALGNLVKVPLVLLLSALTAAPLGLVAWKLLGEEANITDLLLAHARGLLAGSLVLGTLVPIVALYYHSSAFAGPLLANATAFLAIGVGVAVIGRLTLKAPGFHSTAVRVAIPATMMALQAAAMLQLVALASPIFPEPTMFRQGVDGLVRVESERR